MCSSKIIITLAILFLAGEAGAVPVEDWNRTYGNTGAIYDVLQTQDAGYVLASFKYSYGGIEGADLIKTDARGIVQWNRIFDKEIGINSVKQTTDGGFIIAGGRSFYGNYGVKSIPMAIKTNASGIEQWNRTFDVPDGSFSLVQVASEGGYIFTGTQSYKNSFYVNVVKTDSEGNIEWTRTFDNNFKYFVLQTVPPKGN